MRVDAQSGLTEGGFLAFSASRVRESLGPDPLVQMQALTESFENLVLDEQMGDGGRYRLRRFSRFTATRLQREVELEALVGHSILQSKEDNPLNGGVLRTFQPLQGDVLENALLKALIRHDIDAIETLDPELFDEPVTVGVHQVRITADGHTAGKPTPEGIHRDAERYTFQHFWNRQGVSGGHFAAYDEKKNQVFRWLQTEPLDSVLFTGTTWHSASPIRCLNEQQCGFRDIFLIDFTR
jgi:hypothetical protein